MLLRVVVPRGPVMCVLAVLGAMSWGLCCASVAQAGWHPPVAISGHGDIGNATLAVNARGDAIVVWDRLIAGDVYTAETDAVVAAFRPAGRRWQRAVTVGTAEESCGRGLCDFPPLSVAIGASGAAAVGWADATGLAGESVWVASRSSHGVWDGSEAVYQYGASSDPESPWPDEGPPALVVDPHGNVTAAASGVGTSVKRGIQAAYKPAGHAWGKLVRIGSGFQQQLTLDAKGGVLATWLAFRPAVAQSAFRPVGGSWRRPVTLGRASLIFGSLQVAGNARGAALAVWELGTSERAALKPAGGRWGRPVTLTGAQQGFAALEPMLGASGNATVLWSTTSGLQASFRPAHGSWRSPVGFAPFPSSSDLSIRVAAISHGPAIATWLQYNPPVNMSCCTTSVWASVRSAQGTWQVPISMGIGASPSVAAGPRGSALLVWVRNQSVVEARTFTQPGQ